MNKYKVGDWVEILHPPVEPEEKTICRILEVLQQTCEGGVQHSYLVKMWVYFPKEKRWGQNITETKIRQSELGAVIKLSEIGD